MPFDNLPPPPDLGGRAYPGHGRNYPDFPTPPARPKAPPGPPPKVSGKVIPPTPKLMPKPPPMRQISKPHWLCTVLDIVGVLVIVVLVVWALSYSWEIQTNKVKAWAKDYDLRHCIGKYDTPQCHKDRAISNAKAYEQTRN